MRRNFIQCMASVLMLLAANSIFGQNSSPKFVRSTKSGTELTKDFQVGDQLGNVKNLDGIRVSSSHKSMMMLNGCNNTGKFHLYFEEGSGFEDENNDLHQARRDVLCQVFQDLDLFIHSPNENVTVNIWVRNFVEATGSNQGAATASTYYIVPPTQNVVGGIAEGEIWKTINSGVDSYASFTSPLASANGDEYGAEDAIFYHGWLSVNFDIDDTPAPDHYHYDLNAVIDETDLFAYDFYSIVLHEFTHALGFRSLIFGDGESRLGANYHYYSLYDMHLETDIAQPLILPIQPNFTYYDFEFNSALDPIQLLHACAGNCGDPYIPYCETAIKYNGGTYQPVFHGDHFYPGTSLSHFTNDCYINDQNVYTTLTDPGDSYVMNPDVPSGPASMRRSWREEEVRVLCDLGYDLNSSFGGTQALNYRVYEVVGCGVPVVGINDGLDENGVMLYSGNIGGSVTIPITDLLANDFGNPTQLKDPQVVVGEGNCAIDGTNLVYYPTGGSAGVHVLRYMPQRTINGPTLKFNITYILVYIGDPACFNPCTIVPNYGFETNLLGTCDKDMDEHSVQCWAPFSQTPDLFSRTCQNAVFRIPTNDEGFTSIPVETSTGLNSGNDHFCMLRSYAASEEIAGQDLDLLDPYEYESIEWTWEESMIGSLGTPITPGNYILKLKARMLDFIDSEYWYKKFNTGNQTIAVVLTDGYPSAPLNNDFDLGNLNFYVVFDDEITVTYDAANYANPQYWQEFELSFTIPEGTPAKNFIIIGNNNLVTEDGIYNRACFIDDLEIIPNNSYSNVILPDLCLGNTLYDLEAYLNNVSGGTFITQSPGLFQENDGTWTFDATMAGAGDHVFIYQFESQNGCTEEINVFASVNSEQAPTISITSNGDGLICAEDSETLTAIGGITYEWTPGFGLNSMSGNSVVASPDQNVLYTVTGTDANGCSNEATYEITVSDISIAVSNDANYCNTPVEITATGGTDYTWTPATGLNTTTGGTVLASPSQQTTYTVTATTAEGCSVTGNVTIYNIVPIVEIQNPNLFGTGSCSNINVVLSVTNASNATYYSWTANGNAIGTGEQVTALPIELTAPVIVNFVVTGELFGCTSSSTYSEYIVPEPEIIFTEEGPYQYCEGQPPITISIDPIPNIPANNIHWFDYEPQWPFGDDFQTNPPAGYNVNIVPETSIYYVLATNSGINCWSMESFVIESFDIPAPPVISTADITPCTGQTIVLSSTGCPGGTVSWFQGNMSNPIGTGPTLAYDVNGSGAFPILANCTNEAGCTSTNTVINILPQPVPLFSVNVENPFCEDQNNGSIQLTNVPANATINWPDPLTDQLTTQTNLSNGSYAVTVTAANGCSTTVDPIILESPPCCYPVVTATITDASCTMNSDGAISLDISNIPGEISIEWNIPEGQNNSPTLSNLFPGNYSVTITNDGVCSFTESYVVGAIECDDFVITLSPLPILSCSQPTGNVIFNIYDAFGQVDIICTGPDSLSSVEFFEQFNDNYIAQNLGPGTYNVQVTDEQCCTETFTFTLNDITSIEILSSVFEPSCSNICSGSIDLTVNASGPYTVEWLYEGGIYSNAEDLADLCHGPYDVTITADNGSCTVSESFNIETLDLNLSISAPNLSFCVTEVLATVIEDPEYNFEYSYLWSNGSTSPAIITSQEGYISVEVSYGNGCSQVVTGEIVSTFTCQADFNGDGIVGVSDQLYFIGVYGTTVTGCNQADFNDDGIIGVSDLLAFIGQYGTTCP